MNAATPDATRRHGLRERKKREVRRTIQAAAVDLFVKHGYEAVTVDEIAESANVSRTTFFNYFATKEAVAVEPDPDVVEQWLALRETRTLDQPLWTSLKAIVLDSLAIAEPWLLGLKKFKEAAAGTPPVHGAGEELTTGLTEWLTRHAPDDRLVPLQVNLIQAALVTAFEEWSPSEPFDAFLGSARTYLDIVGRAFP